jgi:hypothetical protein
MAAVMAMASGVGGGQGGYNHHCGGHCHLGGQMSPRHWGGDGRGSGGGGKNDHGAVNKDVANVAAGGGSVRHFMWRE